MPRSRPQLQYLNHRHTDFRQSPPIGLHGHVTWLRGPWLVGAEGCHVKPHYVDLYPIIGIADAWIFVLRMQVRYRTPTLKGTLHLCYKRVHGTVSSLGKRFILSVFNFFDLCCRYGRFNGVTDRPKMFHQ